MLKAWHFLQNCVPAEVRALAFSMPRSIRASPPLSLVPLGGFWTCSENLDLAPFCLGAFPFPRSLPLGVGGACLSAFPRLHDLRQNSYTSRVQKRTLFLICASALDLDSVPFMDIRSATRRHTHPASFLVSTMVGGEEIDATTMRRDCFSEEAL